MKTIEQEIAITNEKKFIEFMRFVLCFRGWLVLVANRRL